MEDLETRLKEAKTLIAQVRDFSETCLNLAIDCGFEEYKDDGQNYFWVYASERYDLRPVIDTYSFYPFESFDKKEDAVLYSEQMRRKGYDTYIFEGEAHSGDPQITCAFLKGSIFRKADTLIHEAVHNFIHNQEDNLSELPLDLNEALATYIGKHGALNFCRVHHPEQVSAAQRDIKSFAGFAKLVNAYYRMLQIYYAHGLERKESIFASFREELQSLDENLWRRFENKEINNAFLVRYIDYTRLYPLVTGYFSDKRRTIKSFFSGSASRQVKRFEQLLQKREELLVITETLK